MEQSHFSLTLMNREQSVEKQGSRLCQLDRLRNLDLNLTVPYLSSASMSLRQRLKRSHGWMDEKGKEAAFILTL